MAETSEVFLNLDEFDGTNANLGGLNPESSLLTMTETSEVLLNPNRFLLKEWQGKLGLTDAEVGTPYIFTGKLPHLG